MIGDILASLPHVDPAAKERHAFRAETHFPIFERIGEALDPRTIVEIGAGLGSSLISLAGGAKHLERLCVVDNESAIRGSNSRCLENLSAYIERFDRRPGTIDVNVLRHRLEMLRFEKFRGAGIFHIDGESTQEGVLNDLLVAAAMSPEHVIVSNVHASEHVKAAVEYFSDAMRWPKFIVNSYYGLAFFDRTAEGGARARLQAAGVPLREEIRDLEAGTAAEKTRCWCGGTLTASVSPMYGACTSCGTLVLVDEFSPEQLREFYSFNGYWHDYVQGDKGYPTIERRAEVDFADRIPKWFGIMQRHAAAPRSVLEIGCAHGGFLAYCRERGACDLVGIEVDESTCAFARAHFGLEHVIAGLFPDVQLPRRAFDVIAGFDVLEHIADPVRALRAVRDLLEPAGICQFQIPCYRGEGADWMQMKREHVFLYNEQSIGLLFERAGLRVIEIAPGFNPDEICVVGGAA